MDNQHPLTPEGFRTAAYLAARERLDARSGKTRRGVQCTPPNTKCGNRCIPPEWDCRLKGEGADPHLAARRTDPISGFANIERGVKRLSKFARTGSFSELESGKRSLVRGAVKLKPGNLNEKNEFKNWLEENYLKVAIPLFIAGGAISAHSILRAGNTFGYRDNFGRKVDNAVTSGIGAVLDAIPGIGHARAYTRNRAAEATRANLIRARGRAARDLTIQSDRAAMIPATRISPTLIRGNSALNKALKAVNEAPGQKSFYEWNTKHRSAFWGASHPLKGLGDDEAFLAGRSVYAEPAAQSYLNQAWRMNLPNNATRNEYISALTKRYDVEADSYIQLAKQQGFRVQGRPGAEYVHVDDRAEFASRNIQGISDIRLRAVQSAFINASINGRSSAARARAHYEETTQVFDSYYKKVAKDLEEIAGAPSNDPVMVQSGLVSLRSVAERRRVDYLMQASPKRITRKTSAGPAHDELFLKDYYYTRVAQSSTYFLSSDEAIRAATELSSNEVRSSAEAIQILQQQGFKNARLEIRRNPFQNKRTSSSTESGTAPDGGRPTRRRRRPSDAQLIADRMKAGYSRAEAEAYLARLKEQRGDSLGIELDPREQARAEMRSRLDKRCGKSGIPDNRKCSKTTGAQSEEARMRERGAKDPGVTCRPGMQRCGNICVPQTATCHINGGGSNLASTLAKGALAAGAVAGAVAGGRRIYNTRHANQLYRSSANHISKGIQAMSSKQVRDGISKLPKQWQDPANKLVGKAKLGLAYIAADAQGLKIKHVDTNNNFSTWHNEETGHVLSIGAVDDTLVTFVSERKGKAGSFDKYGVAFQTDLSFSQKENVTKAQSLAISKKVKSMFQNQIDQLPENAVLFNKPFKDDGLGDKRASIYKRFKFRELPGVRGGELYALKNQGKLTAIPDEQADYVAELIKNGDTKAARERYNNRRRDSKDNALPPRVEAYLLATKALHGPS